MTNLSKEMTPQEVIEWLEGIVLDLMAECEEEYDCQRCFQVLDWSED